ncbi:hypothetical protein BD769DRAFT_1630399 [Suillus cothurnatus]|nr:hypothetical protein BD769DRAFT_1630399 [Suillus cothurnatus]
MQSQNDYLRQWLPRQESYLHHLLDREAPPEDRRCIICDQNGVYKCQDCLGEPLYCMRCCRSQHSCNPFHWISQWNGKFFKQSCLAHVGLVTHLGHDGRQCPVLTDMWDLFDGEEPEDRLDPKDLPSVSGPEFQPKENTMVIVDNPDIQMFRHGFFPASFNRPKTVFTFQVLDDFLLDNLECGTSAMNYYSKLRRMTSSMFSHLVLDRYRELMRVARQWRQLKTMKWHGFGHGSDSPTAGDLALFCLACPQPGINVSLSGDESLDDWKYTRSFVMDGNFKAEHLHPIKPLDEVWLSDGLGFMVGKDRQMNMDYALCKAAQHNMEGITRAVTFYDINCQYNKHFQVRVDRSQFLEMVPELTIIPGIRLWHVHGHQDSCYVRYASNFIEGIGQIDGEIMETLWARLNLISPAARRMSSPHQKECLDYQMNDSNFCKMICMKRTLCCKYKLAKNGMSKSETAFNRLDEAAPANFKTEWSELNLHPAPSKKEIELRLLEDGNAHNAAPSRRSVATWISMGLAIEEAQIALLIEVR